MADSIWQRVGERIGWAIGLVALGPPYLAQRHARRIVRRAFVDWCASAARHEPLASPRGRLRRLVTLSTPSGPIEIDVTLDTYKRVARLETTLAALPGDTRFEIASGKPPETPPDEALVRAFAPIAHMKFNATIEADRLLLLLAAPESSEGWATLASVLTSTHDWAAHKSSTYR